MGEETKLTVQQTQVTSADTVSWRRGIAPHPRLGPQGPFLPDSSIWKHRRSPANTLHQVSRYHLMKVALASVAFHLVTYSPTPPGEGWPKKCRTCSPENCQGHNRESLRPSQSGGTEET
jgi:hypothetical protein